MRIPMDRVIKDYPIAYRLASTQCAQNMFRILGNVDALTEKMGMNLSHHDVNWVYNCHKLTVQGYYLKIREPAIRLISCLPESNKGMDKDYLIVSGEWHDGLHCPTQKGTPGEVLRFRSITLTIPSFLAILTFYLLNLSIGTHNLPFPFVCAIFLQYFWFLMNL